MCDGLRSLIEAGQTRVSSREARAVLAESWSTLADALDGDAEAGAVLAALRTLADREADLARARDRTRGLGDALARLDAAPCTVEDLMELAPQLVTRLGFDRAIFSRIVDGVWVSQSVYVPDDPDWAAEINRVGQEQPQPLVRGLFETEIVRRREARVVTDVQHDARVHRPIADASRSNSYVAAPVMAGDHVVALIHADRYRQHRDTDDADCEVLTAYANGLSLAFSRARAAERLQAVGLALQSASRDCADAAAGIHEYTLAASTGDHGTTMPVRHAQRSVRALLTSREAEILEHMANGRTNAAIAAKLFIAEGTVKQHVKHILRKLGAENRVEAVSMLYRDDGA
ncbi:LuxR C-terminal-related transcriptional regulator [Mycolicibacterium sp. J2]|uniref:LuxR C-terminal-related transcriptional regulator n=1 Tax=Mycolicibacterium sp. J2 TaxID=2993511 RepID=UPI00224A89AD|nr:LuxR C-terminal-related transcriptional regulator [Mycolicibacterium sp. J2]MCX2713613.1 LuxR C-terminal-related transcriptional regulator [Mycolicibacterium sp. J2]